VPRVGEADFDEGRLVETANRDLANGIGNLVQRITRLAATDPIGGAVPTDDALPLLAACTTTSTAVDDAIQQFDLRAATGAICDLVAEINRYVERTQPWKLAPAERAPVVSALLHATRRVVDELTPFVPDLAARAATRLEGATGALDESTESAPVAPRLQPVSRLARSRRAGGR
jgi:methionyl-tRNA synthetase